MRALLIKAYPIRRRIPCVISDVHQVLRKSLCPTGLYTDDNRSRGCTFGTNCCGQNIPLSEYYVAVYRNPNYLGCYEPPIPGTQIAVAQTATAYSVQQTYPNACFQTVAPVTVTTNKVSLTSTGAIVVTTMPPAVLWGNKTYPQYEYLGCYLPLSIPGFGTGITTTSFAAGVGSVTDCMTFCNAAGSPYMATFVLIAPRVL